MYTIVRDFILSCFDTCVFFICCLASDLSVFLFIIIIFFFFFCMLLLFFFVHFKNDVHLYKQLNRWFCLPKIQKKNYQFIYVYESPMDICVIVYFCWLDHFRASYNVYTPHSHAILGNHCFLKSTICNADCNKNTIKTKQQHNWIRAFISSFVVARDDLLLFSFEHIYSFFDSMTNFSSRPFE